MNPDPMPYVVAGEAVLLILAAVALLRGQVERTARRCGLSAAQVDQLRLLQSTFELEWDWSEDDDPAATREMLRETDAAIKLLERVRPPCQRCHENQARELGLCDDCRRADATTHDDSDLPY